MRLRKTLTLGAAVLAAGLLGLTATATASTPTGGAVASVEVNGTNTAGTVPINGHYSSGTATYSGGVFDCVPGGTVAGDVTRGPRPLATGVHDMVFASLSLTCSSSLGISATISTSCAVNADFPDTPNPNVHDGTVDTGTGAKYNRVDGSAQIPCGTFTAGACTAKVSGTVNAYFDEAIITLGTANFQQLILDGSGLVFSNQSPFCFGLMTGGITLNNITFNMKVAAGSTTGIDFRQT